MRARLLSMATVFTLTAYTCAPTPAAMLSPGDIIVATLGELSDEGDGALVKVNPVTGDRMIISGPGVGNGAGFDPQSLTLGTMNDIYVVEPFGPTSTESLVFHVDVATGDRQVIASSTVGSGPLIQSPSDVVVRSDGKLVVSDLFGDALVLVDPNTLERSILSSPGVGVGPVFTSPTGMTVDANGDILFAAVRTVDPSYALFRMDVFTGEREVLSAIDLGTGIDPGPWVDLALDGDGQAISTNDLFERVDAINLATGDRTTLSGDGTGTGPTLIDPRGIGMEADGQVVISHEAFPSEDSLIRIDPATGDRTILSGFGIGSGPDLRSPQSLVIVPVPEPSSVILLSSGIVFIFMVRRRRRVARRR